MRDSQPCAVTKGRRGALIGLTRDVTWHKVLLWNRPPLALRVTLSWTWDFPGAAYKHWGTCPSKRGQATHTDLTNSYTATVQFTSTSQNKNSTFFSPRAQGNEITGYFMEQKMRNCNLISVCWQEQQLKRKQKTEGVPEVLYLAAVLTGCWGSSSL